MIIKPETSPKVHKITTYDLEWRTNPWTLETLSNGKERSRAEFELILAGAYDEERGYRCYRTIGDFLDGELVTSNVGRRFYAHFGGASDMVFIIGELAKRKGLEINALFSSSSAIVVRVTDSLGREWIFLDSFWTMRVGLRIIGQWLGNQKGDLDPTAEHPFHVWAEYNEQDCRVLYQAIEAFQEVVNDHGGELRVTGASTALDLFLRRYLKKPLRNSRRVDDFVRPAYIASRVEPLALEMKEGNIWDINSSFPYSFTFPNPGELIGASDRIPGAKDALWCAEVDVSVPDQFLPPLPYRGADGRVFFPTGSFRTRITSEDMLCGGFEVSKVHACWSFEPRLDLSDFAKTLYALRKGSSGFESQVWKIIVNSAYGKFAEGEEKEELSINPRQVPLDEKGEPVPAIAPHVFLRGVTKEVKHSHVPFSAFVTARSRRILREYALDAYARSGVVAYLDTDSIFTPAEFEESSELGGLKREARIREGVFQGPKLYAYEKEGKEGYVEVVKAKGFSRTVNEGGSKEERLTYADFVELKRGQEMRVTRMRRIKELVREHKGFNFTPDKIMSTKKLGNPAPKRCYIGRYTSRAWDVKELDNV